MPIQRTQNPAPLALAPSFPALGYSALLQPSVLTPRIHDPSSVSYESEGESYERYPHCWQTITSSAPAPLPICQPPLPLLTAAATTTTTTSSSTASSASQPFYTFLIISNPPLNIYPSSGFSCPSFSSLDRLFAWIPESIKAPSNPGLGPVSSSSTSPCNRPLSPPTPSTFQASPSRFYAIPPCASASIPSLSRFELDYPGTTGRKQRLYPCSSLCSCSRI